MSDNFDNVVVLGVGLAIWFYTVSAFRLQFAQPQLHSFKCDKQVCRRWAEWMALLKRNGCRERWRMLWITSDIFIYVVWYIIQRRFCSLSLWVADK